MLSNQTLKKYLQEIPNKYMYCYNYSQNKILSNVFINVDLKDFKKNLNSPNLENLDNFEEIEENFKTKLDEIFKNFEAKIKTNYNQQTNNNETIKPINPNLRNLNNNIQIESIQSIIDQIDIKFANLFKIQNKNLIKISNKINQIKNIIDVQLISLNNTIETYFEYAKFYLHIANTLNQYENNLTKIYLIVDESLNEYLIK